MSPYFLPLLLVVGVARASSSNFTSSKVYRISTNSSLVLSNLQTLWDQGTLDFWQRPTHSGTDVMVQNEQEEKLLLTALETQEPHPHTHFSIIIHNVQELLHQQETEHVDKLKSGGSVVTWDAYQSLQTIYDWMENLHSFYPNTTTLLKIGESSEGQALIVMKISIPSPSPSEKKAVFIDATTHAREWVTTSVATWIIKELVMDNKVSRSLLSYYDFYILPVVNPDGYRHSWDFNRLWRKSRRPIHNHFLGLGTALGCRGVDLNRNFGHEWGVEGSSDSSCSLVFKGEAPFSEPETKAVHDFVMKQTKNSTDGSNGDEGIQWLAYFSLHSYGQKWMTPWGYTNKVLPKNYREMIRVARIGANALYAVHKTTYDVGSSSDVLYLAAGGSDDWWKGVVGVKYSYTLELRDSGFYGFLLPASQIEPTAEETWVGIAASLRAIMLNKWEN